MLGSAARSVVASRASVRSRSCSRGEGHMSSYRERQTRPERRGGRWREGPKHLKQPLQRVELGAGQLEREALEVPLCAHEVVRRLAQQHAHHRDLAVERLEGLQQHRRPLEHARRLRHAGGEGGGGVSTYSEAQKHLTGGVGGVEAPAAAGRRRRPRARARASAGRPRRASRATHPPPCPCPCRRRGARAAAPRSAAPRPPPWRSIGRTGSAAPCRAASAPSRQRMRRGGSSKRGRRSAGP